MRTACTWWDGSDEVEIPEETDQWLRKLGERYRKLLEVQETENVDFLEHFFGLLSRSMSFTNGYFRFRRCFMISSRTTAAGSTRLH